MACLFRSVRRICSPSLLKPSSSLSFRSILHQPEPSFAPFRPLTASNLSKPWWVFKNLSHGSVNLVISQGKPKFETCEIDPPKKEKWLTKKRLKLQRKREKQKRNAANKRDPRRLGVKGKKKKHKFPNAEERIKCKLEKAKIKENLLIERLKRYEVSKLQGPVVKQDDLTGEERFYMKKMAQKGSNYVPVGRRGIFGGVILNMHMHWKKHETVKVICKPCKPGQVQEYANDIARLSGGTPIQIIGDDTIIFYRGKDYVQPEVMSPIDTLSKKRSTYHMIFCCENHEPYSKLMREKFLMVLAAPHHVALEKSKYEQSLESVRRFIAIAEKELELYYRHIALFGDPNSRNPNVILDSPRKGSEEAKQVEMLGKGTLDSTTSGGFFVDLSEKETDSTDEELSDQEDDSEDHEDLSLNELNHEDDGISGNELDSCDEGTENGSSSMKESLTAMSGLPLLYRTSKRDSDNQEFLRRNVNLKF